MATLSIPQPVPSPAEDAEALRKACQGEFLDSVLAFGFSC